MRRHATYHVSCKHECSAKDNALISASPAIFVPPIERGYPSPWPVDRSVTFAASEPHLAQRSRSLAQRNAHGEGVKAWVWRASDAGVSFFLSSCQHMRDLDLSGCVRASRIMIRCRLTDVQPWLQPSEAEPGRVHSEFTTTSITGTDTAVMKVARCCPRLTTINISGTRVTDLSVMALAEWCPALQKLENLSFASERRSFTSVDRRRAPRFGAARTVRAS